MALTTKIKKQSPSQQLRGVFYKIWEQNDEGFEDFNAYYDSKMEKLIKHYKKFIKDE